MDKNFLNPEQFPLVFRVEDLMPTIIAEGAGKPLPYPSAFHRGSPRYLYASMCVARSAVQMKPTRPLVEGQVFQHQLYLLSRSAVFALVTIFRSTLRSYSEQSESRSANSKLVSSIVFSR